MFSGKTSIPSGEIRVNGESFAENKTAYFSQLGISFFDDGLYERLTVMDHFKFFSGLYETDQTIDQTLQMTRLQEKKNRKIKDLTFSERKRVQYGRLIMQNPALFIFEEPNLNVDVETKRVFINITKKLHKIGKAILVLTGNMESAIMIADEVFRYRI
ncbi:ATP-binding cassette domain-containing protein [Bacillaceae bacterium Marseille-Q3522]|nr:ATP-binding cassette domain-containing protein [Bacillaceae bacterium Marseille-Q3522]